MRRFLRICVVLALTCVAFSALGDSLSDSGAASAGEIPVIRLPADVASIDWQRTMDLYSARIILNVMSGLTTLSSDGKVLPDLAESWKSYSGGRKYVFQLRKGVVWSDGAPLVAQHFADAVIRILRPETGALGASYWWVLRGARDFGRGKSKDPGAVGVKALDEGRIEFDLERPASFFPAFLAHTIALPIRADLIARFGDHWADAGHLVVLGPYNISEWENGRITLVANSHYLGPKPKVAKFQFQVVLDDEAAMSLFEKGMLDLVYQPPFRSLSILKDRPEFKIFPHLKATIIGFNSNKAPFDNVKVRQAFSLATDRDEIATLLNGEKSSSTSDKREKGSRPFTPLLSWIPKGVPCHNSKIGLSYSPELARKRLAEAGYPDGKNFPGVVLAVDSRPDYQLMAERLQAIWSRVLHVQVEIETRTFQAHFGQMRADAPQMFRAGLGTIYWDPELFIDAFTTGDSLNFGKWSNEKYDHWTQEADGGGTLEARQKYYDLAQGVLLEDSAAIIPIMQEALPVLVSPRWSSLQINVQGKPMMAEAVWQ